MQHSRNLPLPCSFLLEAHENDAASCKSALQTAEAIRADETQSYKKDRKVSVSRISRNGTHATGHSTGACHPDGKPRAAARASRCTGLLPISFWPALDRGRWSSAPTFLFQAMCSRASNRVSASLSGSTFVYGIGPRPSPRFMHAKVACMFVDVRMKLMDADIPVCVCD